MNIKSSASGGYATTSPIRYLQWTENIKYTYIYFLCIEALEFTLQFYVMARKI